MPQGKNCRETSLIRARPGKPNQRKAFVNSACFSWKKRRTRKKKPKFARIAPIFCEFSFQQTRVYPYPLGAGSADQIQKRALQTQKPFLFPGFSVLRGGLRPWSRKGPDHGVGVDPETVIIVFPRKNPRKHPKFANRLANRPFFPEGPSRTKNTTESEFRYGD